MAMYLEIIPSPMLAQYTIEIHHHVSTLQLLISKSVSVNSPLDFHALHDTFHLVKEFMYLTSI